VDLANAGSSANTSGLCVELGVGDGTFQTPICTAVPAFETSAISGSIIAADFNGDGKLDVAASMAFNNAVIVLLGNGDGTFQAPLMLTSGPSGSLPGGIAAADFNGDGKLDLVIANYPNQNGASGSLSVFLGNGDGTFQPRVDYALGVPGLFSVAVGDFNQDGNLDLVTNRVILLGNGDGTFQSPQPLPSSFTEVVITADLNGDGKLDLVGIGPNVSVLLGNGDGTFQSAVNLNYLDDVGPDSPWAVAAADFNADGKVDLAVINNISPGSASILLGNGDGTFQSPAAAFATGPNPIGLAVADFNGDGKTDLAVLAQAGSPFNVNLTMLLQGAWPALGASPPLLSFAQQAVGTSSGPQTIILTNTGTGTLNISNITVTGANAGDFAQTNTCIASLAVNASCQVNVTFTPAKIGNPDASLSVTDNAPGSPQGISLTGSTPPAPVASISPTSIAFPSQYVGTSGLPQNVTITNTGTATLSITGVTTSTSDFAQLSACGSSLAAGASCQIGVFFDPTASGSRSDTLTITDNASGSPQTVGLAGTGQDFSLAASSATAQTVNPGQTASYTITLVPAGGFNQTVALGCSGAPAQSTCAVSPGSVTLSGTIPTSVTVTVSTASGSSLLAPRGPAANDPWPASGCWLIALASGLLPLALSRSAAFRRRGWHRAMLAYSVAVLVVLALGMASCGGGNTGGGGSGQSGVQAGTYPLTITGTFSAGSTTLRHSIGLSLVVQ
jgi:hypothetical protein